MTTLYIVVHYDQETDEDNDHYKTIGIYSTEKRARQAIERLSQKPGFRDYPSRWRMGPTVLDKDEAWTDGFATVYPGDAVWEEKK